MEIKEQTRKLAAGCTWVRQGYVDAVWRDFRRVLYFLVVHYSWQRDKKANKTSLCRSEN